MTFLSSDLRAAIDSANVGDKVMITWVNTRDKAGNPITSEQEIILEICHACGDFFKGCSPYLVTCDNCLDNAPYVKMVRGFRQVKTLDELKAVWVSHQAELLEIKSNDPPLFIWINNAKDYYRDRIMGIPFKN